MNDFKLFWGFAFRLTNGRTNERTDIGGCRVAFATEKQVQNVEHRCIRNLEKFVLRYTRNQ